MIPAKDIIDAIKPFQDTDYNAICENCEKNSCEGYDCGIVGCDCKCHRAEKPLNEMLMDDWIAARIDSEYAKYGHIKSPDWRLMAAAKIRAQFREAIKKLKKDFHKSRDMLEHDERDSCYSCAIIDKRFGKVEP